MKRIRMLLALTLGLTVFAPNIIVISDTSAVLSPGHILITDRFTGGGGGSLYDVDPSTGARTIISDLNNPAQGPQGTAYGVTIDASGNIIVEGGCYLLSVNPATGVRTIISDFNNPSQGPLGCIRYSIAIESTGKMIVIDSAGGTRIFPQCDFSSTGNCGVLFRVDPFTGTRAIISDFGNPAQGPTGGGGLASVAIDPAGNLIVLDSTGGTHVEGCTTGSGGCGALFSVNSSTGTRTIISDFGNNFGRASSLGPLGASGGSGVTIDALGNIIVVDSAAGTHSTAGLFGCKAGCGAIFSVNPSTGTRTIISDFGNGAQGPLGSGGLRGVAIDASGNMIVVDNGAGTAGRGALFNVNPSTGMRTMLVDFGTITNKNLDATSLTIIGDTRAGSNIAVGFPQFPGVSLKYSSVTTRGGTSVTSVATSNCLKGNVVAVVGSCFQFTFTGAFTGGATITLPYDPTKVVGRPQKEVRLFHVKADGTVDNVTISVDLTNKRVSGQTANFQFFAAVLGPPPPFDFSLANSGAVTVTQGASGSNAINVTLMAGLTQGVSLACSSGLPTGASCSFNPATGNPNFTSTLTINTSPSTPAGSSNLVVTGSGGGQTHTTSFTLAISVAPTTTAATTATTPATTSQSLTVRADQSSYSCGSPVTVTAALAGTGSLSGVTVAFEIRSPTGSVIATGSGQTDSQGAARMTFTLPSTDKCTGGTYTVFASASQPVTTATATFSVTAPTGVSHVKLTLSISDANGNAKSTFARGDQVAAKFTLVNDGSTNLASVHVLITFYDSSGVPAFFTFAILNLNAGQQQTNISGFQIPVSSPPGSYRAQAIILTDFLASGGSFIPDGAGTASFTVG